MHVVVEAHSSFAPEIAEGIRKKAVKTPPMIEETILREFNGAVRRILDKIHMITKFDNLVESDVSYVFPPHITGSSVTSLHRGEVSLLYLLWCPHSWFSSAHSFISFVPLHGRTMRRSLRRPCLMA